MPYRLKQYQRLFLSFESDHTFLSFFWRMYLFRKHVKYAADLIKEDFRIQCNFVDKVWISQFFSQEKILLASSVSIKAAYIQNTFTTQLAFISPIVDWFIWNICALCWPRDPGQEMLSMLNMSICSLKEKLSLLILLILRY